MEIFSVWTLYYVISSGLLVAPQKASLGKVKKDTLAKMNSWKEQIDWL